jgi:hypothetical protein
MSMSMSLLDSATSTGATLHSLGSNAHGTRFYREERQNVVVAVSASNPTRYTFYCTWACWLERGHQRADVAINGDGEIVSAA